LMPREVSSPENTTPIPFTSVEQAALDRLDRLENYLQTDPSNSHLLIDAFETALQCGQWDRANFHLQYGKALKTEALSWALREGDFWLAQRRFDKAREVLMSLQQIPSPPKGFAAVALHNLAYVDFQQGNYADCVSQLSAYLDEFVVRQQSTDTQVPGEDPIALEDRALQRLWLRAIHRASELNRAWEWTQQAEKNARLDAEAAGIASLVAVDASDFTSAKRWADLSLKSAELDPASNRIPMEVFVTQATLALAARQGDAAIQWADRALELNSQDGRAWSARAYASLLLGALDVARRDFANALQNMPAHIGTWHGQGWNQILQRDLDAAQLSFETALDLDRNFAESHGGLAVVFALKKQVHTAQEHIERALRLDKSNLSGRYAQAILGGEASDIEALQRLAQRLLGGRKAPLGENMADVVTGLTRLPSSEDEAKP
jgi:tetratricopeptide (TPR) repeat protein